MTTSKLTERAVRALADSRSFDRGKQYFHDGAVSDLIQRGGTLSARVHGNDYQPYEVTIELDGDAVAGAQCSCPYDWGGPCKHIVAVMLSPGTSNSASA